jgi:hypothetical protein
MNRYIAKMSLFITGVLVTVASQAAPYDAAIESVEYGGSGCPQGSLRVELAPDASAFTILYDRFDIRAGAEVGSARQNCEIRLKIKKNKLFSFAVDQVDYRGFVFLDPGVAGQIEANVKTGNSDFVQDLNTSFVSERAIGPMNQSFLVQTRKIVKNSDTLACFPFKKSIDIVIKTSALIENAGGSRAGQITVDSADGLMAHKYNLKWINCLKKTKDIFGFLAGAAQGAGRNP